MKQESNSGVLAVRAVQTFRIFIVLVFKISGFDKHFFRDSSLLQNGNCTRPYFFGVSVLAVIFDDNYEFLVVKVMEAGCDITIRHPYETKPQTNSHTRKSPLH